jgi:uncharacterized surface protein with fasciclin (FAS1) repeats
LSTRSPAPATSPSSRPRTRPSTALPHGTLDALLNDIPALTNILTYHVSADYYPAEALLGQRGRIPTVQGDFLRVDARGAGVHINGSTAVTTADVFASNGVVHIIDGVLLPH